jgi:hypothetical protein
MGLAGCLVLETVVNSSYHTHLGNNSENPHFMTQRGSATIKHYAMPILCSSHCHKLMQVAMQYRIPSDGVAFARLKFRPLKVLMAANVKLQQNKKCKLSR